MRRRTVIIGLALFLLASLAYVLSRPTPCQGMQEALLLADRATSDPARTSLDRIVAVLGEPSEVYLSPADARYRQVHYRWECRDGYVVASYYYDGGFDGVRGNYHPGWREWVRRIRWRLGI